VSAEAGVGYHLALPVARVTAYQLDGVALYHVEVRSGRIHRTNVGERHGDLAPSGIHLQALQSVGEAELEGEVGPGIAVVVDADLVERLRVEREVVGSAVGVLQRVVVGDEGDELFPARLVAAEHVEVRAIDLRLPRDERCLAMAGGERHERHSGGGAR